MTATLRNLSLPQILPYILILGGIIGALASFALTYDKIQILIDPAYKASCNINPIFSCGSIMSSEQSNMLGVPNTIFGLIGFAMLFTLGVVLAAGAKLPRWIWQAAQLAAMGGVVFMHYLFFQGVYRINAICPWCFLVWMITIPIFVYITAYNLRAGHLPLPGRLGKAGTFIQRYHARILIVWYLFIFVLLLEHFWYYWSTLL